MFYACARVIRAQSDDKDTAKTVNFNVLIFFFIEKSDFFLYLCICRCLRAKKLKRKYIKSLKYNEKNNFYGSRCCFGNGGLC